MYRCESHHSTEYATKVELKETQVVCSRPGNLVIFPLMIHTFFLHPWTVCLLYKKIKIKKIIEYPEFEETHKVSSNPTPEKSLVSFLWIKTTRFYHSLLSLVSLSCKVDPNLKHLLLKCAFSLHGLWHTNGHSTAFPA